MIHYSFLELPPSLMPVGFAIPFAAQSISFKPTKCSSSSLEILTEFCGRCVIQGILKIICIDLIKQYHVIMEAPGGNDNDTICWFMNCLVDLCNAVWGDWSGCRGYTNKLGSIIF